MKENCPSITAYKVAMMRASHQILDNPKVFDDPLSLSIIGDKGISEIYSNQEKLKTKIHRSLRSIVAARTRFVELELSRAVNKGVLQYIILGAGLDTFAYRNPYSARGLKVFEVDHPETQEWKCRQLDAAGITTPEMLTFAPVDFEKQSLADQLQKAGFRPDKTSFFSWLGVTMYLSGETMHQTLEHIAALTSEDSILVFDYLTYPSSRNFLRKMIFFLIARKVAKMGEPWKNFLEPASLANNLKAIGFRTIEDMGPEKINEMFFKDRTDKLRTGSFSRLVKARR